MDAHRTIANLGAVGTVIAGTFAFIKGQGQPNRLRRTGNGLRDVKLQARQSSLDFGDSIRATQANIDKLWEEHTAVIKMEEMNDSDTPVDLPSAASGAAPGNKPTVPGISLMPGISARITFEYSENE